MIALIISLLSSFAYAGKATLPLLTEDGASLTFSKSSTPLTTFSGQYSAKLETLDGARLNCRLPLVNQKILALNLKGAGERAKTDNQIGTVLPYNDQLDRATSNLGMGCAIGIDALPGNVVITFATYAHMGGLSVTLSPDDAVKLGDWLLTR